MKVILLEDIENVGKKHEVKEVKDGYAINFLLPKGLAKTATKEALKELEIEKKIDKEKAEEDFAIIQKLVMSMDGREVIIPVKIGDEDQLFESVSVQKICDGLKTEGFNINKKQVELSAPIKELGEFPVKIKFEHNLEAEIRVIIVEKKEK